MKHASDFFTIRLPVLSHIPRTCPVEVKCDSPRPLRRAVMRLAVYFRREFEYDLVPYSDRDDDEDGRAFLWGDFAQDTGPLKWVAWGACCFRRGDDADAVACGVGAYRMQWIWLHPFRRNQGHLTRAWPMFRERFGAFTVDRPWSPAMEHFLRCVAGVDNV